MIVICRKTIVGIDYISNKKDHAYQAVYDKANQSYLVETEEPNRTGIRIPEEIFEEYFRKFIK